MHHDKPADKAIYEAASPRWKSHICRRGTLFTDAVGEIRALYEFDTNALLNFRPLSFATSQQSPSIALNYNLYNMDSAAIAPLPLLG